MKRTNSLFHVLFFFLFLLSCSTVFASDSLGEIEEDQSSFGKPSTTYPVPFPKEDKGLRATTTEEIVDLTSLPFMTIDPDGAQDLDDALYVEKEGEEAYHIAIAIADPTYYIQPHSPIAKEARRRSFTIYGQGAPIPMLPPKLVRVCSLEQGKKRSALIVDLYIDKNGNFQDVPTIYRALICSQNKVSYAFANAIYEGRWFSLINPDLKNRLFLAKAAAQALKSYYSEDREIVRSQDVVSEFMTAANNAAAIVLKKRIAESVIKKAVFRAQDSVGSRALYSSTSSFHASFDLTYTHFTSPVRRYADMMVHWLLFYPGYEFSDATLDYMNRQQGGVKFSSSLLTTEEIT